MQRSSGLHLEHNNMLDDLEDEQYTFTSTVSEHSTRNEQRTPRYIQSDWSILLLQEQEAQQLAQQALELQKQQLRLDLQQAHNVLMNVLHQNPYYLNGTDNHLMRYLSEMDAPEDFFLWQPFLTPSTVPTSLGIDILGAPLISRPLKALLDLDYIHNLVWNSPEFQMIPVLGLKNCTIMDVVEGASILNNLCCTDQQIIDDFREMFPLSLVHDQVLLQLISDGRWKAKCVLWSPEELDIIRNAITEGLMMVKIAVFTDSEPPSEQDVHSMAWWRLRRQWAFYPKTYEYVSAKCEEKLELLNSD